MTFATDYGGRGSANEGSAFSFNIVPLSDMVVAISGLPTQAAPGQTVNGTVTCTNLGPAVATNASCDVSGLPSGATVTCTPTSPQATLAVGGTISCAVSYVAAANTPVTVTGNTAAGNESNVNNNTASQTVGATVADMAVSIAGLPTTVTAGQTVTGTITCLNTGPDAAASPSCGATGLPANATLTCTPNPAPASLAVGSAITCQISYVATASQLVEVVAQTGAVNDPNGANNTATQVVTGTASDMTVALSGFPANVIAGQTVTGTVTCINNGPDAASTALCNVNGLPSGATVSCTPASPQTSLALGAKIECQVSYVAPNPLTDPVTVVGVTAATNETNTTNNTASQKIPGSVADMAVSIAGMPTTVTAGQTVSGTVTCLNTGPDAAATPVCSVTGLPANATLACTPNPAPASLAVGSAITCQISYVATASQSVTVVAQTGAVNDPNANNNKASQLVTGSAADIGVAFTGFPSNPDPGSTVTGQLVCTNAGPDAAPSAQCSVSGLPPGATVTCSPTPPAPLAVGAAITCSISFTQPPAGQVVTLQGSGSAPNDANTLNNTATLKLPSTQSDMAVSATFPPSVTAGFPVSGSFSCVNKGPDAATAAYCNISGLPAGVTPTCTPATPVASLASGASITCTVDFTAPLSGTLPVMTVVTGATNDINPANNQQPVSIAVRAVPAPVPTLGQYLQALLAVLLALMAAYSLHARQRRPQR